MANFDLPIEAWYVTNLTSLSQTIADLRGSNGNVIVVPSKSTIDLVEKGCVIQSIYSSANTGSIYSLVNQGKISQSGYLHTHNGLLNTTGTLPDATLWHTHYGLSVLTGGGSSNADSLHTHNNFVKISDIDGLIGDAISDVDLSIYATIDGGISQFNDIESTGEQIDEAVEKMHNEDHTILDHIDSAYPFTIANLRKLFDGSNADCLHTHTIPEGGVSDHNDLTNIQGGENDNYYHLSLSQYEYLSDLVEEISISNLITLTDGSNADLLHTHNFLSSISLEDLTNVEIVDVEDGQVLIYDAHNQVWTNGDALGNCFYTNEEGSVIEVGGIDVGTTFDNMSFQDFVDMLLYPELFPTLTNPSSTFVSSVTGYREIGEVISSISFTSSFNRGSISPQYESDSPYRSGLPNTYVYTGTGLSNVLKTDLTDSVSISSYTVIIGAQSWTGRVAYDAGVQPKGSKGTNYDSPLSAGQTSIITRTITGVYPFFATTVSAGVMTKQTLVSMSSTYFSTNMAKEEGSYKQTVDFPYSFSEITGIQFYNTVSGAWEWIQGSKSNSLTTFDETTTTYEINGNIINYVRYIHNGSFIGARDLRWYTN